MECCPSPPKSMLREFKVMASAGLLHLWRACKEHHAGGMTHGVRGEQQTGCTMPTIQRIGVEQGLCLATMRFRGAKEVC